MYERVLFVRGVGLLEVVVASALLTLVFVGFLGVLQLGTKLATDNKAHTGAVALALDRMEYIRSLNYSSVGTVNGTPQGILNDSEVVILNNVSYTRITYVTFIDDPADGLGGADSNGITTDYKAVKVRIVWSGPNGQRKIAVVTNISPSVIEQ